MKNEYFDIEGTLEIHSNKLSFSNQPKLIDSKYSLLQNSSKLAKIFSFLNIVECKLNSYMRLVYSTSLYEIVLFCISIFLYVSLPPTPISLFYFLIVVFHLVKGLIGLVLLNSLPKTYQICEHYTWEMSHTKLSDDKKDLVESIKNSGKEVMVSGLLNSKCWITSYFVLNIIGIVLDFIIFWLFFYSNSSTQIYLLESSIFLMIIVLFFGGLIYFFWFITIKFSFSTEVSDMIKQTLTGSSKLLEEYIRQL